VIERLHGLSSDACLNVRQNPEAIDAGAFHNDVAAVGNLNVLFFHASAFAGQKAAVEKIRAWFGDRELHLIEVSEREVPLEDVVASYLFNSQLIQVPDGMALVAPLEARECATAREYLDRLPTLSGPIRHVYFVDVRQSMRNGGGPACLRLRVVLTEREISLAKLGVFFSDSLHGRLKGWIERNYREHLLPADLADPKLLEEGRRALDELTRILGLGSIYEFQKG
jgi:succinylarginine dihydrolase